MSTSSFHSGYKKKKTQYELWTCGLKLFIDISPTLPSALAQRSHTAFSTAALARWITPFSGPNCPTHGWRNISVRIQTIKWHWRCSVITCVFLAVQMWCMQAHPYPSQLALACQEAVKPAKVADNILQGLPNNQFGQCFNSTHHYETMMNRKQSRLTDPSVLFWKTALQVQSST